MEMETNETSKTVQSEKYRMWLYVHM